MYPWDLKYPNVNNEILNLDWILDVIKKLTKQVEDFTAYNNVTFANPIEWDASTYYKRYTIVLGPDGNTYLSKVDVPIGVPTYDSDYWEQLNDFNAQIADLRQNITWVTPQHFGAKGDGLTDDTEAMKAAFNSPHLLFIPNGAYLVHETLDIPRAKVILGEHPYYAYIKLTQDNDTLLNLNNLQGSDSSLCVIENVGFRGTGKTHGQIGIDCKGWQIKMNNLDIRDFDTGIKMRGVSVYLSKSYITTNRIGVELLPQSSTPGNISTMIIIDKCYFDTYDIGLYSQNDNDVQSLKVTDTVFEVGRQAINLAPSLLSYFSNNWLERNTDASSLYGSTTVWMQNNTIGETNQPVFTGTFPSLLKVEGGDIEARNLKMTPNSRVLTSDGTHYCLSDGNTDKPLAPVERIIIKHDGTVQKNTFTGGNVTIQHTVGSGKYNINFDNTIYTGDVGVIVQCFNATDGTPSWGRHWFINTNDASDYTDYMIFNRIRVECGNYAQDAWMDCNIIITFIYD